LIRGPNSAFTPGAFIAVFDGGIGCIRGNSPGNWLSGGVGVGQRCLRQASRVYGGLLWDPFLGSAYGAAFPSNQWYPDRLNTVRLGVWQGSLQFGFDFAGNLGDELLPDLKRKMLRRKP
jgi:hypothetical protein